MRPAVAVSGAILLAALSACGRAHDDACVQSESSIEARPASGQVVGSSGPTFISEGSINPRLLKRFAPLAPGAFGAAPNEAVVDLGHQLFFDPRLSAGGDVSCFSCHDLPHGGADPHATSAGSKGRHGDRNAPTVLNAGGAFALQWDGRASRLEDLTVMPLLSPNAMGPQTGADVVLRLKSIPGYQRGFSRAFPADPEPVTVSNLSSAIAAYERQLVAPGRWDKFLQGDRAALTSREKEGLRTFLSIGCMVCHTGPLVGGNSFEKLGAVLAWPNEKDTGRMRATSDARDKMMFKVPTLRNVARTAPYFHDGSAATLQEAVTRMGHHQLGIELTEREVESIVSWLRALDGDADPRLTATPTLP